MTLKQAFTEWAAIPQNTALAARSRIAIDKVLLKNHGDDDVRQFTAFYTRKLMQDSKLLQPLKTQAASILVHVLKYAAEKKACVKPDFDFSIAKEHPTTDTASPSRSTQKNEAASDVLDGKDPKAKAPESPLKEKRHSGGRPRIPVVQVDPQSGKIIAKFEGKVEAALSVGANKGSVATAIDRGNLCKGYYWFPADTKESKIKMFIAGKLAKKALRKNSANLDKSRTGSEAPTTRTYLSSFSDEELKGELKRRGWTGTLCKHLIL